MIPAMLVVMLLGAGPQAERVLNLGRIVSEGSAKAEPFVYEGACQPDGSASGGVGPAPPFAVRIDRLDRVEYAMGGRILADVLLTNTGENALPFPWVLAHEFGERSEGADALQVAIGLDIIDSSGREHGLTGTILRGAARKPGTLEMIAAGETIRIRLVLRIPIIDSPDAPRTGDAMLFARLDFNSGNCHTWAPIQSPRMAIRFKGRD